MREYKNIAIISFTKHSLSLNKRLGNLLQASSYAKCKSLEDIHADREGIIEIENLKFAVADLFAHSDAIIFIGAIGIAIRLCASHIKDKFYDPAILCMDEKGEYVIPILSGHIGGANELAVYIAKEIDAIPILTTATDIHSKWAVDVWARENHLQILDRNMIKRVSADILEGKSVHLHTDYKVIGQVPEGIVLHLYTKNSLEHSDIAIQKGLVKIETSNGDFFLAPQIYALGMGAKKDADVHHAMQVFEIFCKEYGIIPEMISDIRSIDIKKEETAIWYVAKYLGLEPVFLSARELLSLKGKFSHSEFVQKTTGVDCVCERAAYSRYPKIAVGKTAYQGITFALSANEDFVLRF